LSWVSHLYEAKLGNNGFDIRVFTSENL